MVCATGQPAGLRRIRTQEKKVRQLIHRINKCQQAKLPISCIRRTDAGSSVGAAYKPVIQYMSQGKTVVINMTESMQQTI